MKLQLLSQQGKESLFLCCVFFSICGGMQQPLPLCRQCISVRTPPAASGLRSGPAGWFVQGRSYPAPVAGLALQAANMPEAALGVGKWTSCSFHLSPAAMLSLHIPCITSSRGEECAATFPSSAQLLCSASCARFSFVFSSSDCLLFKCKKQVKCL